MRAPRSRAAARLGLCALGAAVLAAAGIAAATASAVRPPPESLELAPGTARRPRVLDREGRPLSLSYDDGWNLHDQVRLHEVPELLQAAFVAAEDRRYRAHRGVDWAARLHAAAQNLAAGRAVRGASTITEQVGRMLRPRPRTLWSRWVEGFEARGLERRFTKADILEFYLNQVPYASRRRGVAQAARWYFDRGLDTLSVRETLALAVLVRAPGRLDLRRDPGAVDAPVRRLAARLHADGALDAAGLQAAAEPGWRLGEPGLATEAGHFVRHVLARGAAGPGTVPARVRTTLDSGLQRRVQALLDERLRDLRGRGVRHGAALVAEQGTGAILAWCVGGEGEGSWYDAVLAPRQPGSALKPFVYALALERGWTAATVIEDAPLEEAVGAGLHAYRNYSRAYYGPVTLREALGNSLNTPAVRAARFVGPERLLERLRALGFASLGGSPDRYGDGLALGNGEVTLLELVGAYAALARGGAYRPLAARADRGGNGPAARVFDETVATLVGDILSDPEARRLEFGAGGLLAMPVQTAVKTGTSSDYRDAWAVGYNHRFTAGVWMGDLAGGETEGVSGSLGPALVLRGIFAELGRDHPSAPLRRSPRLERREVCRDGGRPADGTCPSFTEWFLPGTGPGEPAPRPVPGAPAIGRPAEGLRLAMDPRIPDALEAFEFALADGWAASRVEWLLDGELVASSAGPTHRWPLRRGAHRLVARVWGGPGAAPAETVPVSFTVR